MYRHILIFGIMFFVLIFAGCVDNNQVTSPEADQNDEAGISAFAKKGVIVVNGWYEEVEIYYIEGGVEEGVTQRGENDLYLIGGARAHQANVAEFIPGEPGYSPHWNINLVQTEPGVTVGQILMNHSDIVSTHYPEALFDDVADILTAESRDLVTITPQHTVVLCPVVPEKVGEAPGNTLIEDVPGFDETMGF